MLEIFIFISWISTALSHRDIGLTREELKCCEFFLRSVSGKMDFAKSFR